MGWCFSKAILDAVIHQSVITNHRKHGGDLLGSPVLLKGFLAPSCGEWDPFSENQRGALKAPAHLQRRVKQCPSLHWKSHIFPYFGTSCWGKRDIILPCCLNVLPCWKGVIQDVQDCWVFCSLVTAKFPKCYTKIHLCYRKLSSS